ncbi:hypothetical protein [Ferruginibacter sp.]|uniref:hypothetical protein n=1 Tax=Ferruginibacter sp. TaxID=1940288 RepID=UPI0019886ECC|nr:hypothetical protein [Ferruginibacter sp.]MBC7628986.1 hypothetical protein [Ferruginibacter sp.]
MKKQASGTATNDQKILGANKSDTQNKKGKTSESNGHSTEAASSKVKSKAGNGMANKGTR